jgi:2-polyprenyl-6-methoxyphenol hydroxylase-like FAD-dependent oxidoreductase
MAEILIAGAGIGGLTAALSLHAAGYQDVVIAEAATRFRPLGAGINILPSATRELAALGLLEELSAQAVHTRELRLLSRHGALIWKEPCGAAAGYAWPQLSVHRSVLQRTLLGAIRARLGPDAILMGSRVTRIGRRGKDLTVTIARQAGGPGTRLGAGLVIGADGIHSAVRSLLRPGEGEPKWNGWVMWRGTGRVPGFLDGRTMVIAGDPRLRIVAYPISAPGPAGILVNWVVACPADGSPARYGDWDHPSGRAEALRQCAGCETGSWLDVAALISCTPRVTEYPMVDRDPLPSWTRGRTALLGDAAHPMYPAASGGATQAIIDGRALAYWLASIPDPGKAMAAYDRDRRPAATAVQQLSNREMGPDSVFSRAHDRIADEFTGTGQVIQLPDLEADARRQVQARGLDTGAVNGPSPYDPRPGTPGRAREHA